MAERYLPDAFVFVFALTFLMFVLGLLKGYRPREVLDFWGDGFSNIDRDPGSGLADSPRHLRRA